MSSGANEASTYPDSWDDLPGTRTQKPGHEHANAKEQEYYLQDEAQPVKKGSPASGERAQGERQSPTGEER